MGKFYHLAPGDRLTIGQDTYIIDERPEDWPRDWQHGIIYSPDRPCEPAGERCGPHRCSWPAGMGRCVVGDLWDREQSDA